MTSRTKTGGRPDQATGSWACEALPMTVRRELLQRELHQLGLQRVERQSARADDSQDQQQCQQARHPQAD